MLLMFAPVSSPMAMQQSHCDMDADTMSINTASSTLAAGSHDMHASHDMSSMTVLDSSHKTPETQQHQCCCDGNACAGDCDMGMTVSLLIQTATFAPLFINVAEAENVSSAAIVRELTPPSRPPAAFS